MNAKLKCFIHRNGENFVYTTSDWLQNPTAAAIYSSLFIFATVIIHFLVNFIHVLRRVISMKLLSISAPIKTSKVVHKSDDIVVSVV